MADTIRRPLSTAKANAARQRALNEIERAIDAAAEAEERLRRLRAAVESAKASRDALIRQAALLGGSRTAIAKRVGISRQHLYEALNAPHERDDEWIEHLVDLTVEAENRWIANGQKGTRDEYWPL